MAEKEERILIARSTDYTITDTDKGARFDGKIAPHCANVLTRQEAIERMAKALFNFQYDGGLSFENAYDGAKKEFRLFAKAALDTLLSSGETK